MRKVRPDHRQATGSVIDVPGAATAIEPYRAFRDVMDMIHELFFGFGLGFKHRELVFLEIL